jgi:Ala-tRNA(Pro) deacylase
VNAHPLVNTQTTTLASADLIKFLEATGHSPRITVVTGEAAALPE